MKPSILQARHHFPLIAYLDAESRVYLDSAATSQKPQSVLDQMTQFYQHANANPRRGTSLMSNNASEVMESARSRVAQFIHAPNAQSIVFTKNTTESLNLVASGWALHRLKQGDEIVVTEMEHHSNLLPWQRVAKLTGAQLKYAPVDQFGNINIDEFKKLLTKKTRIVAVAHVSNVFGTVTPLKAICAMAHAVGAVVVVDGAQTVAHYPVDVSDFDADFYAFSAHKMYGPLSVGVLYGKPELLQQTEPLLLGGSMVHHVTQTAVEYADVPYRFEGGTQNVAGVIGLQAAIDYIEQYSWQHIYDHENALTQKLRDGIAKIPNIVMYNAPTGSIVTFEIDTVHPHDVSQVLDSAGVTVRSGHHCAEPLMQKLGVSGLVRVSVGLYNNEADIDLCLKAIKNASKRFHHG